MKKSKILLLVNASVLAVAAIGITVAFMFKQTEVNNTFKLGRVSCTVHEKLDGGEFTEGTHEGNQKHSIKVENTGNIKAYIRVKVVSYWTDEEGNVVGLPSEMPDIDLKSGWLEGEPYIYYYSTALEPSAFTDILCSPINLKTNVDADGNTVYQAVDIFAEAVQAQPADAAAEAWGVTVDENGIIKK